MKIAILTQPLHTNYGGTLQAYALQKVLTKLGYTPETINYRKRLSKPHPLKVFLSKIKQLINNGRIYYNFTNRDNEKISSLHSDFIKKNINYSVEINNVDDLNGYINKNGFNAIVIGSDQTWRPKYSPRIESFYLDFLANNNNLNKIAYAASFGTSSWEYTPELTKRCGDLLKGFNFVSVREVSGVELCKKNFSVQAEHVLDPTMLLNLNDYQEFIDLGYFKENEGKIFCYVLDEQNEKNSIIEKIVKIKDKDLFVTFPKKKRKEEFCILDYSLYQYPSIELWLSSYAAADFIITDSFHGTVFSIIFNKPFIAIANEERGSARFTSLLELFHLENRLVSHKGQITNELIETDIDYEPVNRKLHELKEICIERLHKSLTRSKMQEQINADWK